MAEEGTVEQLNWLLVIRSTVHPVYSIWPFADWRMAEAPVAAPSLEEAEAVNVGRFAAEETHVVAE